MLLSGLQAAGKTSILKVLDHDFTRLHQLKPTMGTERTMLSLMGMTLVRWDLGGQEKYRQRYLAEMEKYFGDLTLLLYVIDVQEAREDWIQKTLDFLGKILDFLRERGENPIIAVLFHKFDPDLLMDESLNRRMRQYMDDINEIKGDLEVWYYPTSIFDRVNLVNVFSHVILQVYPQREIIEDELKKIRAGLETPILCLADSTPFILGRVVRDGVAEATIKRFESTLLSNISLVKNKPDVPKFQLDLFDAQVSFLLFPFKVNEEQFFIAGLWDRLLFANPDDLAVFEERLMANVLKIEKVLALFFA